MLDSEVSEMKESVKMNLSCIHMMKELSKLAAFIGLCIAASACAAADLVMPVPPGTAKSIRDIGRDTTIVTNIYALY